MKGVQCPEQKSVFFKKHSLLLLMIFTNIIFVFLYWNFITGQAVYMYADTGSDSFSSSYPVLSMVSDLLHSGNLSSINITYGLGTDITATLFQYLNPVKLIMVLFPHDLIPVGILLSLWVQVNLLSIFSWNFFRLLLNDRIIACFPAAIWTFSGYVILWGQNYSFLTSILLFTACMYFLQLLLTDAVIWKTIWFVPILSIYLFSSYYFLYMTGFFCIFYTIGYLLTQKKSVLYIIKKLALLAAMAVSALAIAAAGLLAIYAVFTSSDRVSSVSFANALSSFTPKSGINYLTYLGRLFSVNTFGAGSGFSSHGNYYEVAVLSTSVLFLFSDAYLIIRKKTRKITIILNVLSIILLIFPFFSKLLIFNAGSERWSFLLSFLEVTGIGIFLSSVVKERDDYALKKSLIISAVFTIVSFALMYGLSYFKTAAVTLRAKTVAISITFVTAYTFLFIKIQKDQKLRKRIVFIFVLLLTSEMVLSNYATINNRAYVSSDQFQTSFYNDGSSAAVSEIQTSDQGLYRISNDRVMPSDMTTWSFPTLATMVYANEGAASNYASTNIYSSTIPKSLCTYTDAYGISQLSNNFFVIDDFTNYYIYTLLCGKYRINDSENLSLCESPLFTSKSTDVSGKVISENLNSLPFGYLYTKELSRDTFDTLDSAERMHAVTEGFFYTDKAANEDTSFTKVNYNSLHVAGKLSSLMTSVSDCIFEADGDSFSLKANGNDAYAVFKVPSELKDKSLLLKLKMEIPEEKSSIPIQIFYTSDAYPVFGADLEQDVTFTAGQDTLLIPLPTGCSDVRIDIMNDSSSPVVINEGTITDCVSEDFNALEATDITGISFTDDTYNATLNCPDETGMLCVPMSFSKYWTASVNGKSVSVENINGGLCGIPVEKGISSITMHYALPHFKAACAVSIVSFLLFIILFVYLKKKN